MSNYAVIYWSGGGNTEEMAKAVTEGIKGGEHQADLILCDAFDPSTVANYEGFAFGCSAQGSEVLEEGQFQPLWDKVKTTIAGKNVVLFGSYGWGGGEFMNLWEEDAQENQVTVVGTAICQESPNSDTLGECSALGKKLFA